MATLENWSPRDVEVLGLVFKEALRLRVLFPDIRVLIADDPDIAVATVAELVTSAAIAVRVASEAPTSA